MPGNPRAAGLRPGPRTLGQDSPSGHRDAAPSEDASGPARRARQGSQIRRDPPPRRLRLRRPVPSRSSPMRSRPAGTCPTSSRRTPMRSGIAATSRHPGDGAEKSRSSKASSANGLAAGHSVLVPKTIGCVSFRCRVLVLRSLSFSYSGPSPLAYRDWDAGQVWLE